MATTPLEFLGYREPDSPVGLLLDTCVRCGLCLPYCPTYLETYRERSSPRGRIDRMRGVARGDYGLAEPGLIDELELCLGCRACEAACPAGVQYGTLLEKVRSQVERVRPRPVWQRALRAAVYDYLLNDPKLFRRAAGSLRLYQRSGLRQAVRRSGLLKPLGLDTLEQQAPELDGPFLAPGGQTWRPPAGAPPPTRRVALFVGCVMGTVYAEIDRATARVLAWNGCAVVAVPDQVCCGALHAHGGHLEGARRLARRNIAAFQAAGYDAVVVNAAGCGALLKEYAGLLRADPHWAERAKTFSAQVYDLTEYLAAHPITPPQGRLDLTATYQEPCHLTHAQRIKTPPRQVLQAIPGLKLVEMAEADVCCGSAGTYNLTQPEMSQRLLRRKLDNAAATGAQVIATANPGCLLQLRAGGADARHIVELLDAAYGERTSPPGPLPLRGGGVLRQGVLRRGTGS